MRINNEYFDQLRNDAYWTPVEDIPDSVEVNRNGGGVTIWNALAEETRSEIVQERDVLKESRKTLFLQTQAVKIKTEWIIYYCK